MKILSLFDGISCARVALERAGIEVEEYTASEIDKYAIQVSQKNYPDIIRMGDVKNCNFSSGWYNLLIGGSPCQDLSIAKKDRKGLDGERSGLFWEYVRILKEVKPKYFILENVASMPKEAKVIITEALGVEPIMINASLVSAQNRKRLFWTNIPNITLPEDKGILLKDIIDWDTPRKWRRENTKPTKSGVNWDKSGKGYASQQDRAYKLDGKFPTIPTARTITKVNFVNEQGDIGVLHWHEIEKLQGLPKGYTDLGENNRIEKRGGILGNAFNVDVVAHILSFIQQP